MGMITKWADTQKEAFEKAMFGGAMLNFVQARGGTGELRRDLTAKERTKRKTRKHIARASRQRNR